MEYVADFCWLLCMIIASYCTRTHSCTQTHTLLYVCVKTIYRHTQMIASCCEAVRTRVHALTHGLHQLSVRQRASYSSPNFNHRHTNQAVRSRSSLSQTGNSRNRQHAYDWFVRFGWLRVRLKPERKNSRSNLSSGYQRGEKLGK